MGKAAHNKNHPILVGLRKQSSFDRFLYYIRERYAVRVRRLSGAPRPWTEDPILHTYKFTNVKREWDAVSQWLLTHWYKPHGDHPNAGAACAFARFFNHIPTLEAVGFPDGDPAAWLERSRRLLLQRREHGAQIFTGAYIISAAGSDRGSTKIDTVITNYLLPVVRSPMLRGAQNGGIVYAMLLHDALHANPGWGHFMTQEVICDLMFTHVLRRAPDRKTYGMAGPGALRGIARVCGLDRKKRIPPQAARDLMLHLYDKTLKRVPVDLRARWTVHDVEFNLCEFDKYERTLLNQSTPKQRYTPAVAEAQTSLTL